MAVEAQETNRPATVHRAFSEALTRQDVDSAARLVDTQSYREKCVGDSRAVSSTPRRRPPLRWDTLGAEDARRNPSENIRSRHVRTFVGCRREGRARNDE